MTMMEAPTLFPEPVDVEIHGGRGLHGYYRNIKGWIVVQPTTPANKEGTIFKGGIFLPHYGEFKNGTAGGKPMESDDRGMPWNPAEEPWRLIFQRRGAEAFPLEQILAYHWHIRPPYREVEFPQLEGVDVTDYFCPECEKGIFSHAEPLEAADQLKIHLTSGIDRRHEYRTEDLTALGDREGIDFFSRSISRRPVRREVLQHTCPECGQSFSKAIALAGHRRSHKVAAPA